MARYLVYDVFTDRRFGGNPLAVFPDATAIAEADLQRIARELNLSETTFVTPGERPRVRIFTPMSEMPFAGHPTIGTAIALHEEGGPASMVLELGVGPIPVEIEDGLARFVTTHPLERLAKVAREDAAACLGVAPDQIVGQPVQASVGAPFTFAEVAADALGAVATDVAAFRRCAARYPSSLDFSLMAYVREGRSVRARMFAPLDGIPEDPATGSAAAALAALLAEADGEGGAFAFSQGAEMGRPSEIAVDVTLEDGRTAAIGVAGRAVRVLEGRLA